MQKQHQVVMLSTEKAAGSDGFIDGWSINIHPNNIIGYYNDFDTRYFKESIQQHLYILSDEEIKEGECIYNSETKEVYRISGFSGKNIPNRKKVIASTDKSLGVVKYTESGNVINGGQPVLLPNLSIGFIEKYIKMYNLGTHITDVTVEYHEFINQYNTKGVTNDKSLRLNLRTDNTIIIHPIEIKMYTEAEMILNLEEYLKYRLREHYISPKDWLKTR